MFRRLDRSQFLLRLLARMSDLFALKRGLPMVIGIGFVSVSMLIQSVAVFSDNEIVELLGVITHNLGVLIALIGLIMVTPLGGR